MEGWSLYGVLIRRVDEINEDDVFRIGLSIADRSCHLSFYELEIQQFLTNMTFNNVAVQSPSRQSCWVR